MDVDVNIGALCDCDDFDGMNPNPLYAIDLELILHGKKSSLQAGLKKSEKVSPFRLCLALGTAGR